MQSCALPSKKKIDVVKLNSAKASVTQILLYILGISIDCAEILKFWKLVDDLLKRPNTKGVLGIHQLTNKIH